MSVIMMINYRNRKTIDRFTYAHSQGVLLLHHLRVEGDTIVRHGSLVLQIKRECLLA